MSCYTWRAKEQAGLQESRTKGVGELGGFGQASEVRKAICRVKKEGAIAGKGKEVLKI